MMEMTIVVNLPLFNPFIGLEDFQGDAGREGGGAQQVSEEEEEPAEMMWRSDQTDRVRVQNTFKKSYTSNRG